MEKQIEKWIDEFVSVHNEALGSVPCPYARSALTRYEETQNIGESLLGIFAGKYIVVNWLILNVPLTSGVKSSLLMGITLKFSE